MTTVDDAVESLYLGGIAPLKSMALHRTFFKVLKTFKYINGHFNVGNKTVDSTYLKK